MIIVLTGENSFEIARALEGLRQEFDGTPEVIDGSELTLQQLPDLLMGGTLFAPTRLVIMKGLASNGALWSGFEEWLPRVADSVQLVLVEPQLDKRTKTYKALKAAADLREFPAWKDGDLSTAQRWVSQEVAARGLAFDAPTIRALVERVGADQWQLHYALEKLAVLDTVTPAVVQEVIEQSPHENVFGLLDAALKGDRATVARMVATFEHTDDAYRLFGLLATQATQLAALTLTDRLAADVAKELSVHPFALSKMERPARKLGRAGAHRLIQGFVAADHRMKTSAEDPWNIIATMLMNVAAIDAPTTSQ